MGKTLKMTSHALVFAIIEQPRFDRTKQILRYHKFDFLYQKIEKCYVTIVTI